ncbi:MAG TPA: glycoside hydrolase family 76 protein [Acidobacteriaceae bacterium]
MLMAFLPMFLHAQTNGDDARQRIETTARLLAKSYNHETGLFDGTGWWNSANGITALVNASRALRTSEFDSLFANTFVQAQRKNPGFLNEFYDDEGWWALAWLDLYELRGGKRYLEASQAIFKDMTGGWSETCGGGIWWKKNERYKNAIANELFLALAMRLAADSSSGKRAGYLDWARKEERWFVGSGMINGDGLINDGLDASCHNNQKTTWSYNQGVILPALAGMAKQGHETDSLRLANRIAEAVSHHLVDGNGILHDPCEPQCGADGVQFKGILVRNLAALQGDSPSPRIASLLHANAESVWAKARSEDGRFSVDWSGPAQDSGTGGLISALDALTAPLFVSEDALKREKHSRR